MKPHSNSANVQRRTDQMVSKLREHDFRITPQRLAVIRVLAVSDGHPSVEKVYETIRDEFPTTSIATIYKTVHLLKHVKEVLEIAFPDVGNRYDGNKPYPHPHVICIKCKKIVDPDLDSLDEKKKEVELETNFKILNHSLDFFGIYSNCMAEKV
jgi:Fur family transcriptional regulator, peroxide stress response regulator